MMFGESGHRQCPRRLLVVLHRYRNLSSHRISFHSLITPPQASNKFIDASGTFVAKEDMTKDANVVTPIYESTSTFYGGSENDSVVETLDAGLGGARSGYYKFRLGDFKGAKTGAVDIADFDNAWHEAFNIVHGTRDGIYFAGESIFKIEEEPEGEGEDMVVAPLGKSRYTVSLDV